MKKKEQKTIVNEDDLSKEVNALIKYFKRRKLTGASASIVMFYVIRWMDCNTTVEAIL
ncbi:MAG: hypothetical protein JRI44_13355, partial [Deltaproteobacteria bacterium]|nr:hypothetical protein [Deltaproteobacteria bacterium]